MPYNKNDVHFTFATLTCTNGRAQPENEKKRETENGRKRNKCAWIIDWMACSISGPLFNRNGIIYFYLSTIVCMCAALCKDGWLRIANLRIFESFCVCVSYASALNYASNAPDMQYIHIQSRWKVLYALFWPDVSPLPHIYVAVEHTHKKTNRPNNSNNSLTYKQRQKVTTGTATPFTKRNEHRFQC